jgi:hypothetical protein
MTKEQGGPKGFQMREDDDAALPPMTFTTLVLSLSTSALAHMGMGPGAVAEGGVTERSLPLAQQTIDILEILQEKTRGNLEPEEARILEDILHELHLAFVRARENR